ncbi:MAG TPA: hypothetical protein VM598_12230, partial [Bdellovibrionota bacterium]|nr:hypothetical protein [Bdellovibrionota bacterium]
MSLGSVRLSPLWLLLGVSVGLLPLGFRSARAPDPAGSDACRQLTEQRVARAKSESCDPLVASELQSARAKCPQLVQHPPCPRIQVAATTTRADLSRLEPEGFERMVLLRIQDPVIQDELAQPKHAKLLERLLENESPGIQYYAAQLFAGKGTSATDRLPELFKRLKGTKLDCSHCLASGVATAIGAYGESAFPVLVSLSVKGDAETRAAAAHYLEDCRGLLPSAETLEATHQADLAAWTRGESPKLKSCAGHAYAKIDAGHAKRYGSEFAFGFPQDKGAQIKFPVTAWPKEPPPGAKLWVQTAPGQSFEAVLKRVE